jgi:hypothetical protein
MISFFWCAFLIVFDIVYGRQKHAETSRQHPLPPLIRGEKNHVAQAMPPKRLEKRHRPATWENQRTYPLATLFP